MAAHSPIIKCTRIESTLSGATRPFIATTSTGARWVVKAAGNPQGNKVLFNELLTGRLAHMINLPWPQVSLVHLSAEVILSLDSSIQGASPWAVGLSWIEGLRAVPPARGTRNAAHLSSIFQDQRNWAALYGKILFDNWTLLGDTKHETLQIDSFGNPLFLDASHAFGGTDWDLDRLKWDLASMDVQSPYLEGLPLAGSPFEPWLNRLIEIDSSRLGVIFEDVPDDWEVPSNYAAAAFELLSSTSTTFVPLIREWIEWRETISDTIS